MFLTPPYNCSPNTLAGVVEANRVGKGADVEQRNYGGDVADGFGSSRVRAKSRLPARKYDAEYT